MFNMHFYPIKKKIRLLDIGMRMMLKRVRDTKAISGVKTLSGDDKTKVAKDAKVT